MALYITEQCIKSVFGLGTVKKSWEGKGNRWFPKHLWFPGKGVLQNLPISVFLSLFIILSLIFSLCLFLRLSVSLSSSLSCLLLKPFLSVCHSLFLPVCLSLFLHHSVSLSLFISVFLDWGGHLANKSLKWNGLDEHLKVSSFRPPALASLVNLVVSL
jgi:hypothetical protein